MKRVSGIASHAPSSARYYQTGPREQRPQTPQFDREFDLKEEIEMPSPQSRAKQKKHLVDLRLEIGTFVVKTLYVSLILALVVKLNRYGFFFRR